jgi:hypothetical protein
MAITINNQLSIQVSYASDNQQVVPSGSVAPNSTYGINPPAGTYTLAFFSNGFDEGNLMGKATVSANSSITLQIVARDNA